MLAIDGVNNYNEYMDGGDFWGEGDFKGAADLGDL